MRTTKTGTSPMRSTVSPLATLTSEGGGTRGGRMSGLLMSAPHRRGRTSGCPCSLSRNRLWGSHRYGDEVDPFSSGDPRPDEVAHPYALSPLQGGGTVNLRRLVRGPALGDVTVHRLDQNLHNGANALLGPLVAQLLGEGADPSEPARDGRPTHLAIEACRLGPILVRSE